MIKYILKSTKLLIFCAFVLTIPFISSCDRDNEGPQTGRIEFSMKATDLNTGGRTKATITSVLVSIKDSNGNFVHEKKKLALYKLGKNTLVSP